MDLILRNARLTSRPGQTLCDIGIEGGRIAAIEPTLHAEGREIDVQGRLVNAGFVETHIHLDKSCLLDRCTSEKGDLDEAIEQVAAVKKQFTARRRPRPRRAHPGKMHPARYHPHAHPPRSRPWDRAAELGGRPASH